MSKKSATRKRPTIRGPYEAQRVITKIDPESGITRQSFRDECDVEKIVDTFARTGMVNHIPKAAPVYGDCPEQNLFEAACVQAEIRSSEEEAVLNPSPDALRGSETDDQDEPLGEVPPEEPEAPPAAEDESRG